MRTLICLLVFAGMSAACTTGDLGFLAGVWSYSEDGSTGQERWVATPAGTLIGSTWEAKGTKLSFVEALSISQEGDRVEMHLRHFDESIMHSREEKDAPMVFVLSSCSAGVAVFDGTGQQAGEHITYRGGPARLTFIGDFPRQGKPFTVTLDMRRAATPN